MGPLHLLGNTDRAYHHSRNAQGNTTSRPPPLQQTETDLQMRRLQKGHDTNGAIVARPQRTGFSPWDPVLQGHGNPQWCPQRGKRRPEGAATIATNGGGFRPENVIPAARSRPMTEARTPPQPRHLNQEKPGTARGATTAPPASTCQPPTLPPRRRRTSNAVEEEKRSTTIWPKRSLLKRPLIREDLKVIQYQSQEADNIFNTSDGTSPSNSTRKWAVKHHYREDNN